MEPRPIPQYEAWRNLEGAEGGSQVKFAELEGILRALEMLAGDIFGIHLTLPSLSRDNLSTARLEVAEAFAEIFTNPVIANAVRQDEVMTPEAVPT